MIVRINTCKNAEHTVSHAVGVQEAFLALARLFLYSCTSRSETSYYAKAFEQPL